MMDQLWEWGDHFAAHPVQAVGLLVALIVAYVVLNRKPKYVQDADEQLRILRRERKSKYDELRPPS